MATAQQQRISETAARRIVRQRSLGRCEIQRPGVCRDIAAGVSHRHKRGQGGLWQPSNLMDACGSGTTGCHGWVEAEPGLAEWAGLTVPSWRAAWPSGVAGCPVWMPWGGWHAWWHLNDDGTLTACQLLTRPPWLPGAGSSADLCTGLCT